MPRAFWSGLVGVLINVPGGRSPLIGNVDRPRLRPGGAALMSIGVTTASRVLWLVVMTNHVPSVDVSEVVVDVVANDTNSCRNGENSNKDVPDGH